MRRGGILGGMAAMALGVAAMAAGASPAIERDHDPVPPAPKPKRPKRKSKPSVWNSSHSAGGSIAEANRHGGEHKHSREIERRKRQASRAAKP
jgi:hypothetical protein